METPADLPKEIITEILIVLPVKTLLRFKCVCKSWLSLISSTEFIKTHLKHSINNENLINHRIMFSSGNNFKHCSAHSLMFEPLTVASEISSVGENLETPVPVPAWIVDSCNGLICFEVVKKDVYIWNPSTRTSKKLPSPGTVKQWQQEFDHTYGFGYTEFDDDYKVVGIFCEFENEDVFMSEVNIYSLRANSWKRIGDFEGGEPLDDPGRFASGKLYFLATPETEIHGNERVIISLDLKSEVYGKVELPNYEEGYAHTNLGVVGGCICVTVEYPQIRSDVWVLKECDVKESWTNVVSIPYITLRVDRNVVYSNILLILPSGEILLVFDQKRLVIYNPKYNCLRRPGTRNINDFDRADVYVESLVSLEVEN